MAITVLQRFRRSLFALVFILSATILPLALSQPAEAMIAVCRGDPIINLSRGSQLKLSVDLSIPAAEVVSLTYTVHAPAGVTIKKVIYPPDSLTGKESVLLVNDSKDHGFHVTIVAQVLPGTTGSMLLTGRSEGIRVTATGLTSQPLSVTIAPN